MSTIKKEQEPGQSKKGKRVNDGNLSSLKEDTIIRHKKLYKNNVTKNQMKDITLGRYWHWHIYVNIFISSVNLCFWFYVIYQT